MRSQEEGKEKEDGAEEVKVGVHIWICSNTVL